MESENKIASETKLLGNKRDTNNLKDNLIFRRFLTGKICGTYEQFSTDFINLFSFDWDDEKLSKAKLSLLPKMTSSAFWFCISAMYFPFVSNEIIDKSSGIPEILQKVLERNIYAPRTISIKNKLRKKKILMDFVSLIDTNYIKRNEELMVNYIENSVSKKQINIENLINAVSDRIESLHKINQDRMATKLVELMKKSKAPLIEGNGSLDSSNYSNFSQSLKNLKILTDNSNENFSNREYDREDILIDMQFKSKFKKQFEEYIIRKHEEISENQKEVILSRSDEEKNHNPDDIVCLVCNDGDYEDNNLIVYCSKCQMTVHQQCYGIVTIPEEDWLCYPCQFYEDEEKAKQIECILCPIKGGAMKPCCLKIKSSFWNNVISLRRDNYRNNYFSTSNVNGFVCSNSAPNLIDNKQIEEMKIRTEEKKDINEKKDLLGKIKNETKMEITNSPKNYSSSQKISLWNQESLIKNLSNRTITESNEDNLSVKYFNQDPNMDIECQQNNGVAKVTNVENANPILKENSPNSLVDDNIENAVSTYDMNLNSHKNQLSNYNRQNKENSGENAEVDSYSTKEIFEKTNAEILSNESIHERNNKLNIDLNLNLNENDNLSLNNDLFNKKNATNLNESMKLEDEKSNNANSKNKSSKANRRRGRQKKNIRNKKEESKGKEDSTNVSKPIGEFVSAISRKSFNENAWVHLSCALWIPEVLIEDFEKKENIKNIENIDKKRFNEKCSICNWGGCGPTIKCENADCKVRFHIECARINKFQMEFIDNSSGEYKYYIFCRLHQPHRMIKNIELKRQNEINDIKAFRTLIQRCFEVLDINENITYSNYTPSKLNKYKLASGELSHDDENNGIRYRKSKLKMEISSKDKKDILNQIRNVAIDVVSGYSLVFKKQIVKKDPKNSSENPSEKPIFNEEMKQNEEKIIEQESFDKVGYKLNESNDPREMEIDDGNDQKVFLEREIEINEDKKDSLQDIYENALSNTEENIEKQKNSFDKSEEMNIDQEMEIPSSVEKSEANHDSHYKSDSPNIASQERFEKSIKRDDEDQLKIDRENIEINDYQGEKMELQERSKITSESNGDFVAIVADDNIKEIKASEYNGDIQHKENGYSKTHENLDNNIKYLSKDIDVENQMKDEPSRVTENTTKIKDKKQSKEYTYKIQNYRNLKRDALIISNHLSYNDTLNPRLFPWFYIKCGNKKPIEIVNLYKRWIKDEETYRKEILKLQNVQIAQSNQEAYNITKKGKKKTLGSRDTNVAINNQFSASNNIDDTQENKETFNIKPDEEKEGNQLLFCYCKDSKADGLMAGCENEPNCPNNGWIHKLCDEELRSLTQEEIERDDFKFLCRDCRLMSELNTKAKKGKRKSKKK